MKKLVLVITVWISIMGILLPLHAEEVDPIQVSCGGVFKPKVSNVKGQSDRSIIGRLMSGSTLARVPTDPAIHDRILAYTQYCSPNDASLIAQCRQVSQQDAMNDAVENCQHAAQSRGDDDNLYRCKREDCAPPIADDSCVKLSTKNECDVPLPQLQCRCTVGKFFEEPDAYTSTVACGCNCTCTASGYAEMQCTNCDGTCVQIGGTSFCGEANN